MSSFHSAADGFLLALHHEDVGAWTLTFSVSAEVEDRRSFSVDLAREGVVKGRLTTSRQGLTDQSAVDLLRSRALGWIADYESRRGFTQVSRVS